MMMPEVPSTSAPSACVPGFQTQPNRFASVGTLAMQVLLALGFGATVYILLIQAKPEFVRPPLEFVDNPVFLSMDSTQKQQTFRVRLSNNQKTACTIEAVQRSCPCLQATNCPLTIPPGQQEELEFTLSGQPTPGRSTFTARAMSDAPGERPTLVIYVN